MRFFESLLLALLIGVGDVVTPVTRTGNRQLGVHSFKIANSVDARVTV